MTSKTFVTSSRILIVAIFIIGIYHYTNDLITLKYHLNEILQAAVKVDLSIRMTSPKVNVRKGTISSFPIDSLKGKGILMQIDEKDHFYPYPDKETQRIVKIDQSAIGQTAIRVLNPIQLAQLDSIFLSLLKEKNWKVETGLLYTDSIRQINLHSNKDLSIYSSLLHTDIFPLGIEKEMTVQAFVRFHPHWILQKEGRPLLYVGIIWIVLCGIYVFVWIYQRKSSKRSVVNNKIKNKENVEEFKNVIDEKVKKDLGEHEIGNEIENDKVIDVYGNEPCEEVKKEMEKDVKQEINDEIESEKAIEVLENEPCEEEQKEMEKDVKQEINDEIESEKAIEALENEPHEEEQKEMERDVKHEINNEIENEKAVKALKNEFCEETGIEKENDIKQEFEFGQKSEKETNIQIGKYIFDKEHGILIYEKDKNLIRKTQEYIVLNSLVDASDNYCTEEDLLKALDKKEEFIGQLRSVISRLRKCFIYDASIQIVREGCGYQLIINSNTTVAENTANESTTINKDIQPDADKE
ncbi:hypothetical protein [Parabacteroides pacaensis]|uniref:hypothetical protein n=1 Tax=Parabacteroides pacaensis TaxID=2086575 RepID=UPI000D0FF0BF|nr:hypothetical protein [Parabacteroides pacaensis]